MLRAAAICLIFATGTAVADVETHAGHWVARFENPTHRYGHGILGNLPEWGRICLHRINANFVCLNLPEASVFEDISPRLADMDGDGVPEAIVVQSSRTGGAALSVYFLHGKQLISTSTPEIGRRNRWLAPIGIADFNGDGDMDVAYIDRPHLARTLRVWSFRDGQLVEIASKTALTNHRIGEEFISGGIRDCGQGPEMITADADWSHIMATRFEDGVLTSRQLGIFTGQSGLKSALNCKKL